MQALDPLVADRGRQAARRDPRPEKALAHINVPEARDRLLIEESSFDGRSAARKSGVQRLWSIRWLERLGPQIAQ